MKNSVLLSTLAVLFCFLPVSAQNLLLNGQFSFWNGPRQPLGWTVESLSLAGVDQDSLTTYSVPYSARITRNVAGTGSNFGLRQYVSVVPNTRYTLSAWCYDDDPNARGGILITWTRADSTSLGSTAPIYSDSAVHGWQLLSGSFTSPDSASLRFAKVLMRIYGFTGGPAGGVVYYDDANFAVSAIAEERASILLRPELSIGSSISSGQIRVSVNLPQSATITIAVYDLTGTRRAELFSGRLTTGHHDIAISATSIGALANGLYFVVMEGAAPTAIVQKLALQR